MLVTPSSMHQNAKSTSPPDRCSSDGKPNFRLLSSSLKKALFDPKSTTVRFEIWTWTSPDPVRTLM